jgi:hypothetical protein
MTGEINDYIAGSYREEYLGSVTYGDGSKGKILGIGSVNLKNGITLREVLHVQGIQSKLISLKGLVESGRKIVITKHGGTFIDNAYNHYKIQNIGNLFSFCEEERCMLTNQTNDNSEQMLEAHSLLGHSSEQAVRKAFPKLVGRVPFCEICAKAKIKSKPYRRGPEKYAKAVLQNIHSDLKGPLPQGWNGEHYIILIIDEYSRYAMIQLLESKGEAAQSIKNMINELESVCKLESKTRREVSGSVINFKTDGGGEYLANDLQEWCKEKGISHLLNSPYSPSTNGLAEKLIQNLMGKTKSILLESGLNISLWPYAALHSAFLYNITPHSSLQFKTPYEILFNKKYDSYEKLMKFGTYCIAHKGGEILYKSPFESSGFDGAYLGTDFKTGLHLILDLKTFQVHPRVRTIRNSGNFIPKTTLEELGLERGESEYDKYLPDSKDEDYTPEYEFDEVEPSGRTKRKNLESITKETSPRKREKTRKSSEEQRKIIKKFKTDCEEQSKLDCEDQPRISNEEHNREILQVNDCEEQSKNSCEEQLQNLSNCEEQFKNPNLDTVTTKRSCEEQFKNSNIDTVITTKRPTRNAKLNAIVNINDLVQQHALIHTTDGDDLTYDLCKHDPKWIESMKDEISSLKTNQTWILVPRPKDHKVLKSKWVYKVKTDLNGEIIRHKSRLVVQGFRQNFLEDYIDTFSSVLHKSSFRCLLSIAASEGYTLRHIDIDTAFLNADIEEGVEIFIEQPEGFRDAEKPDYVCLLKKSLYGIKQAPRLWEDHISNYLQKALNVKPTSDPCILRNEYCIIALYVDDIIIAAKSDEETIEIFKIIQKRYKCKDLGKLHTYIGFEIKYAESGILITQRNYIDKMLRRYNLENCKPSETPFKSTIHDVKSWKTETQAPFRSAIGALLYLSNGTRPDIAFVTSMLARYVDKPTHEAWECAKHVFRYLQGTKDFCLEFSPKNSKNHVHEISAYSDSDWAGDKINRRSTSGSLIFHNGNLVDWSSKLQKCISLSSCEAEIIAMSHTAQDIVWIKRVIKDLQRCEAQENFNFRQTPIIYADNQSALQVARDPQHFGRMKHVELRNLFVREKVNDGTLLVQYVPSKENIADILTKATNRQTFMKLREKLCFINFKEK